MLANYLIIIYSYLLICKKYRTEDQVSCINRLKSGKSRLWRNSTGLLWTECLCPKISYAKDLILSVIVFGDGSFWR